MSFAMFHVEQKNSHKKAPVEPGLFGGNEMSTGDKGDIRHPIKINGLREKWAPLLA